jgi:hypothetical protein
MSTARVRGCGRQRSQVCQRRSGWLQAPPQKRSSAGVRRRRAETSATAHQGSSDPPWRNGSCAAIAITRSPATPSPLVEQSSRDVDAVAPVAGCCNRTEGVTTIALAPRTRADTNGGPGTVDDVRLASRHLRVSWRRRPAAGKTRRLGVARFHECRAHPRGSCRTYPETPKLREQV